MVSKERKNVPVIIACLTCSTRNVNIAFAHPFNHLLVTTWISQHTILPHERRQEHLVLNALSLNRRPRDRSTRTFLIVSLRRYYIDHLKEVKTDMSHKRGGDECVIIRHSCVCLYVQQAQKLITTYQQWILYWSCGSEHLSIRVRTRSTKNNSKTFPFLPSLGFGGKNKFQSLIQSRLKGHGKMQNFLWSRVEMYRECMESGCRFLDSLV